MSMAFDPRPAVLEGTQVRLEPLSMQHAEELFTAGRDEAIWKYMPLPPLQSVADAQQMIEAALEENERGLRVPFAIIDRAANKAVGSTSYLNIYRPNRNLEIGATWLSPSYQRTGVNTECKYLLLRHAFEILGAIRVQLKTDARNEKSQRAIERIGAMREGVMRNHMILWNGYVRDTVFYSIIDTEWPIVKQNLERMMQR